MRTANHLSHGATNRGSRARIGATTLLTCAVAALSSAACSDGQGVSSEDLDTSSALAARGGLKLPIPKLPSPKPPTTAEPKPPTTPEPKQPTPGPVCKNPNLGAPKPLFLVSPTAQFVDLCDPIVPVISLPAECAAGPDTSEVGLDYGNFPFRNANFLVDGSFFYAVLAPGYEDAGFLDGQPGNLSDTTPSAAPGDRGSGDTEADRTITANGMPPALFPATHGTHPVSFPPSQFEVIQLIPFDETPDGRYEIAVCPTGATNRCQCAFDTFTARPHDVDGGSTGTGGAASTGGATSTGGVTSSAGGTPSSAGGTTSSSGGAAPAAGGSGGAPCDTWSNGGASELPEPH
ncbi:MAG TPA: hypothetical protein VHC69_07525 [Polyangiaceae bacterium]|nr:hypothetical protein [Polyangiaceae bacterium]